MKLKELFEGYLRGEIKGRWELYPTEKKACNLLWWAQCCRIECVSLPEWIPEREREWAIRVYNKMAQ